KNPFVANHLLRKIEKLETKAEEEKIVTWSRKSTILPAMIGHTIKQTTGIQPAHGGFNPRRVDSLFTALMHLTTFVPLLIHLL
ncbi:30S ribosomal protein S19 chloroplastic, partial [Bienertia sinuspersici]